MGTVTGLNPSAAGLLHTPCAPRAVLPSDDLFLAACPTMVDLRKRIEKVAAVNVPVLLLGESGVGKEVVARLIHNRSLRAHHTLLKVNCAAVPGDLLESELFGYEAGAFTGATKPKLGQLEICNKGTVLLDEIAEMRPALQAKLLHVLEDQQFVRLGGRSLIRVDVRILAATNVDIERALATDKLRADLYYRLNAITLRIPPLRERRHEIPLLLEYFLEKVSAEFGCAPRPFPQKVVEACLRYSWPGNVRELKNFVSRYLVLEDEEEALEALEGSSRDECVVPADEIDSGSSNGGGLKSLVRNVKIETERKLIESTLWRTNWNRGAAARLLNISKKALYYKIRQYRLS